ncbi:unnamed protein product [Mytilus edulis]|uniref:Uncharacterized protein n=1 Tax=Mytilus edulis TaxID=6550 RepID=A0A8S3Q5U9_MYTED|nr:unnamed protein product [Mytilus edulis]
MDRTLEQFNYDRLGNSVFVVGIDIGSVSSGYAFASRNDIMHDPPKLNTDVWFGSMLLSSKCPTAILLDMNEEIQDFGFKAEEMYSKFLANNEHDGYYYFKYFRNDIHLQREAGNAMIKDVSGKPLKAVQVMGQTIGYFKHEAMNKIRQMLKVHADDDDFYFVLTVPATWNDQERHFMKQASYVVINYDPDETTCSAFSYEKELIHFTLSTVFKA